jgi:thiamine transport system substrate-binding protein
MIKKLLHLLIPVGLLIALAGVCVSAPQALTVYTYSSFPVPLIEKIKSHFAEKYHLTVNFRSFSDTGPLFNQLLQEKSSPQADLVIGLDNNYAAKAGKFNLFSPYRPKAVNHIKKELIFDRHFRLIPYDYGFIVFNFNREALKQVPRTHKDLLDPAYKGKIIIENPLTSSPGQVFLLTTIALYGEKGYLEYWKSLRKNILALTPGWDEAYGMYTNGEAPIVLSYGTSPVYHLISEKTEKYQALVLDGAAYAQIEGMGIVKGSKHTREAKLLVDYILDPDFQAALPEQQFMYPIRSDVPLPASFRIAAKADRVLNLPQAKVEANLQRWLDQWEKAINQ